MIHPFHRTTAGTIRYHTRLKARDELWAALPLVGLQKTTMPDHDLELRNCKLCGSTLARRVPKGGR